MPSPFPGMNPYLEQASVWHDFHQRFITRIADDLTTKIRPKYHARIDENVYIHELSAEARYLLGRPDVAVLSSNRPSDLAVSTIHREAPVVGEILPATDILREPFIEIRDNESKELVTAIELLSPANKSIGADREQYIAKRRRLFSSPSHLVEIDLLRGGPRMPIESLPQCDYVMMVSRSVERPRVGLWPVRLKERLPEILIPLRDGDPDVVLDLQPLLHAVYDAAGYEDYIYGGTPSPPLHPEDAKWAAQCIGHEKNER